MAYIHGIPYLRIDRLAPSVRDAVRYAAADGVVRCVRQDGAAWIAVPAVRQALALYKGE